MITGWISPYVVPGIPEIERKQFIPVKHYEPCRIMTAVVKATGIHEASIRSASRKREIVTARHLYLYMMCMHTKLSLNDIGHKFNPSNPMDHSSVRHGKYKIIDFIKIKDKEILNFINLIKLHL